jgi:hypothetical protein
MKTELQKVGVRRNEVLEKILEVEDYARKELEEIYDIIENRGRIIQRFLDNPRYGFDWPLKDFFKCVHGILSSQSYGIRIQNKVAELLGLESSIVDSRGDFSDELNNRDEFKVSFLNRSGSYRFLQVRPWEEIGHVFLAIDESYNYVIFFLTKNQIQKEIGLDSSICHGKTELRTITLNPKSTKNGTFVRWLSNYRVSSFEALKNLIK